jgi:hypothetical protein
MSEKMHIQILILINKKLLLKVDFIYRKIYS